MDSAEYQRVRDLFHRIAELSPGDQRAELDRADLSSEGRRLMDSLLEGDEEKDSRLDPAMSARVVDRLVSPVEETLPERIAGFRVRGILGRGGMGVVYRALQESPQREIAVKVLHAFSATPQALRRFEYEAEILARLDHPYVAKVIESGITQAEGAPYLAMELVRGCDLLTFVEREELGRRETIELFQKVCDGVHHAHQNRIVHRDLKPGNILVSEDGSPRILDFGIARPALDAEQSTPGRTLAGSVLGTLSWMSPEQARGELETLDVRADVYSLGAILYRLLAGRMPHETEGVPMWEAARRICEEPHRPLSQGRPELRGDLEAIVGKALSKEPERRYASAGALSDDLQRHLSFQPVSARPPTAVYQLRRFARRHRSLVGLSLGAIVLLLGAFVTVVVYWKRAERATEVAEYEADHARREALSSRSVTDFLVGMFEAQSEYRVDGTDVTVREVLDRAVTTLDDHLASEPEIRARLMHTMGRVYTYLGLYEPAFELTVGAAEVQEELAGTAEAEELRSERFYALLDLVTLHGERSEWDEASRLLERLEREGAPRLSGLKHPELDLLAVRARTELRRGELEPALRHTTELVKRARLDPDRAEVLDSGLRDLAVVYERLGRLDEAEAAATEAYERRLERFGSGHPRTLVAANDLTVLLWERGDVERARENGERTLEGLAAALGSDHPYTLACAFNLATLALRSGQVDQAREELHALLPVAERKLDPRHPDLARMRAVLGEAEVRSGHVSDAIAPLSAAVDGLRQSAGASHPTMFETVIGLAMALDQTGDRDAAEDVFRRYHEDVREATEVSADLRYEVAYELAEWYRSIHELEAGEEVAREAIDEAFEAGVRPTAPILKLKWQHARIVGQQRDLETAEHEMAAVEDEARELLGEMSPDRLLYMQDLAFLRMVKRDLDGAAQVVEELLELTPQDAPERAFRKKLAADIRRMRGDG